MEELFIGIAIIVIVTTTTFPSFLFFGKKKDRKAVKKVSNQPVVSRLSFEHLAST